MTPSRRQQARLFKDAGLDVNVEFAAGGPNRSAAVQGTLQLANGLRIHTLANSRDSTAAIPPTLETSAAAWTDASLVKARSGESVADLKGKRIGVNTITSVNWLYTALPAQARRDPSLVTYVEIPFLP